MHTSALTTIKCFRKHKLHFFCVCLSSIQKNIHLRKNVEMFLKKCILIKENLIPILFFFPKLQGKIVQNKLQQVLTKHTFLKSEICRGSLYLTYKPTKDKFHICDSSY